MLVIVGSFVTLLTNLLEAFISTNTPVPPTAASDISAKSTPGILVATGGITSIPLVDEDDGVEPEPVDIVYAVLVDDVVGPASIVNVTCFPVVGSITGVVTVVDVVTVVVVVIVNVFGALTVGVTNLDVVIVSVSVEPSGLVVTVVMVVEPSGLTVVVVLTHNPIASVSLIGLLPQ